MSIKGNSDLFVNYIKEEYDGKKIVEVGIGDFKIIYSKLDMKTDAEIVSTDILGEDEDYVDDIRNPNLSIYKRSELIYSIRPPIELQKYIAKVCKKVNSDLIIVPFDDEISDLNNFFNDFYLKNLGKLAIYRGIISDI